MNRVRLISLIVAIVLLLTACAPSATPTAQPIPNTASTATMQPVDTIAPTAIQQATATTAPTATAAPAATETMAPTATATQAPNTLVDVAAANGSFKTLVAAVQAAGLVDALKSDGPFTVFAPTDDAFAKLPKGTLDTLLKPENKAKLAEHSALSRGSWKIDGRRCDHDQTGHYLRWSSDHD